MSEHLLDLYTFHTVACRQLYYALALSSVSAHLCMCMCSEAPNLQTGVCMDTCMCKNMQTGSSIKPADRCLHEHMHV